MRAALLAFCLPLAAQAWDPAGHMLVGQVAWEYTSVPARERVFELVQHLDNRFNEGRQYNFITAGCWMDDMRALGRDYQWSKLHYVTIPWTESGEPAPIPEAPHIVSGIAESTAILRDRSAPFDRRVEALGMLIHYYGDIHQPLHTTDRNNDRGGNAYLIAGVDFSDLQTKRGHNLHTFWDKAFRFATRDGKIVELWSAPDLPQRPNAPGEGVIALQAQKIILAHPRDSFPELKVKADATAIARESHVVGCRSTYPPGEPPTNSEVRTLTPEFVQASYPIATRRVALAGYRLAAALDELFSAP
jgi:hypothetical protein